VETAAIVHPEGEKAPGESEVKVTLPVGVMLPPFEESVIVAVQLDAWSATTELAQVITVEVARELTVTLAPVLVLVL
jgi:hypothetical protein